MQDQLGPVLEAPSRRVRRTHSKAFKARLVAQAEAGGTSVAQIAMNNQINANQLRKWMNESSKKPASNTMVPVCVTDAPSVTESGIVMELSISDASIRFHRAWDPLAVAKLIKALR
jgi:transposase-like protein